jgi:uncharacterized protein YndB with AHSA1/START domain
MTRTFNAPRAMVFDALTKPDLLKRWFGPPPSSGWSITRCEADLRVGGSWRIELHRGPDTSIVLHGVYRELARPDRYVATQLAQGCGGQGDHEALTTTVLAESNGKTTFTNTVRYPSKAVRDNVLASGGTTEQSMSAIYDKLAALLESIA